MKRWMTRLATVGAATAVVGLWLPIASANAAVGGALGGVRFGPDNMNSSGQAGYYDLTAPATSSVSAKFTVPTISGCTSAESGVGFGSLIFSNTGEATGALLLVGCFSSAPVYEAVTLVNGSQTIATFTPAPGDVIKVKSKETASSASTKLDDVTQGQTVTGSASSGATNDAILAGVDSFDGSSGQLPVPTFTTVQFTGGKIDGVTVGTSGAKAYNMNATNFQVQIKTSALTGGNAWTEKFIHS
jgi:hypothetical protein